MSDSTEYEAFRAAVLDVIKPRGGHRSAINAVLHWCNESDKDTRKKAVVEAAINEDGPRVIARALRAGEWSGHGLEDLWKLLKHDRLKLTGMILGVPEQ